MAFSNCAQFGSLRAVDVKVSVCAAQLFKMANELV